MSRGKPAPLVIHGWTVFAHPLFLAQLEALAQQAESFKKQDQVESVRKNASKRLAAITKLAFDVIPQDPTRPEYRQGKTLGDDHKHWFHAKFFQPCRLCFRYHAPSKVIVLAWVNDKDTKHADERNDAADRVFCKMVESGHPPDDWNQLLAEALPEGQRLEQLAAGMAASGFRRPSPWTHRRRRAPPIGRRLQLSESFAPPKRHRAAAAILPGVRLRIPKWQTLP